MRAEIGAHPFGGVLFVRTSKSNLKLGKVVKGPAVPMEDLIPLISGAQEVWKGMCKFIVYVNAR